MRPAIVVFLLAGLASIAFCQQYTFLPLAGAPKNVRTLFQDSQGRLWMGGDQLACFDGARLFFLSDYGFPNVAVYSIAEDAGGVIFVGAETGVYRFSNGRMEEIGKGVAVSVTPASPDVIVAAIGPAGLGIPTNADLVRISRVGKQWKTEKLTSLDASGPLTPDRSGSLLYVATGGWKEIRLEDAVRWRPGAQLPIQFHAVAGWSPNTPVAGPVRILRDRFGCVWVGTEGGNQYTCGDGHWEFAPFNTLRSPLSEGPDGTMLLVGYNILAVGRPGRYRVALPANGLPQLFVAMEARDGTIWLGGAQGLYRFASPFRMEYWTPRDGVDSPWALQRLGTKIYAGLDRSIAVLSKDRLHWQALAPFPHIGQVMNFLPLDDGNMLVALNPGGAAIVRPDGSVISRFTGSPDAYGLRAAVVSNQEIWLGGIGLGELIRHGSRLDFSNHYLLTQPAGNVLDVQYEQHTRKLWACYNGGLTVRSEDGKWREITRKDGLLVDACWSLAALPNGDVWYGYYTTPAFALIHPIADGRYEVRQFRAGDGIRDAESLNFDVDRRGWLWRGGNRGLSVADEADAEKGKWLYLDQSDGLSGEGVNSGSYFEDSDGSIWMGIDMSILHYSPPEDLLTPQFAPQVFVSAYSWNGAAPKLAESVSGVPPGSKVVAHIGSLQFDRRNAMLLRYRVLPDDSSWHESPNLDLPLGSLHSGTHSLEIQGRVFTGPWSAVVRRSLVVLVPAWRSSLSLFLYGLTGTLLAIGGYLWKRRSVAEEAALMPDLAGWRVRALLPELHEVAGTLLDNRFEVGGLLARGGFANVMEGYDRLQKKRCAIKVFRSEVGHEDWIQRRFEQEVAALQHVHHTNVVSIYAHGNAPSGAPYLVMEFIEGRNLREVLESGPLAPWRAARLLRQISSALDAIHAQGIWHRDVKPENLILRREGARDEESVLVDFSIAIVKDANETLHGLSRAAGSFDYMAPEQAIGYAEASTDIYSLAKVAIEVLTGRRLAYLLPDASLDLAVQVRKLLRELDLKLSAEAIEMLARALEFDPSRRPHVAGSFVKPLVRDLEAEVSRPEA